MHEYTGHTEPAGAAWRQQALRVLRAPTVTTSAMPLGSIELLSECTFAQHGILGDPQCLVVAFAVRNRGVEVAPLVDVAVSFAVTGAMFREDGGVLAGWDGGFGWTYTATRMGETAQITLSSAELLRDGAVTGATFRIRVRDGVDMSGVPLEISAIGHAEVPDRPATPSALSVPVERLEL